MSRVDCFNGKPRSGLAIKTNGGIFQHPSLTLLNEINSQISSSSFIPFLQNVSSLFPAALLIQQLFEQQQQNNNTQGSATSSTSSSSSSSSSSRPLLRILDACSAPGGKASHILSQYASSSHKYTTLFSGIRLVCTEKSAPRAKQLKKLLEEHHGEEVVNECVLVVPGDANKILKSGTKEYEAVSKFFGIVVNDTSSTDQQQQQQEILFDGILLDPPCTGFGLRPRLRTFEIADEKGVENSADYQRKLLSTAVALTRPGGFISYSTCTTSNQENEMNVEYGVKQLPLDVLSLKDVGNSNNNNKMIQKALSSGMCRATMEFVEVVKNDDAKKELLLKKRVKMNTEDQDLACVLRFGPSSSKPQTSDEDDLVLDGVGFFMTMFRKHQ